MGWRYWWRRRWWWKWRWRPATRSPTRYLYNYGDWHVGDAGSASLCYKPRRELVLSTREDAEKRAVRERVHGPSQTMIDARYNVIIVGGGIVGLAVALEITERFPRLRLLLLEKEDRVGRHQSGHNSGVIHSGVYYKPGSLQARLCLTGAAAMIEFCREHDIPHKICGKLIVATGEDEFQPLQELHRRGEANGVAGLRMVEPAELHDLEPHASGLRALVVPSTGI